MNRGILAALAAALLTGCTVGPNYQRPSVATPTNFRAPEPLPPSQAASLADAKWFEVFKDDKLQELIRTALVQNFDLRDAVARVEAARANLGITRSNQFPQFGASGGVEINRLSRDGAEPIHPSFCHRRIGTSDKHRLGSYRLKSTFGAGCGAPPKPPARSFSARTKTARRLSPRW